ncbi:peptidoglycan editing factor PgeF [Azoarcus olearius]|uniref:peptidoglycan editing factor PgeF n=1 Tax=Azoarcus sp. (strain BH72) TaxID=418699 RepID=UPI000A019FF8|nr:peptidoglycan editing factor PgeF [Azoarcus olearius]
MTTLPLSLASTVIVPAWPLPPGVRALLTTRRGGHSAAPYDGFNLGTHVGDRPADVAANRALLQTALPAAPCWLDQVHGVDVADADCAHGVPVADAAVARRPGVVCAVMTADCLPVLFSDDAGTVVAAAHAGWRGLAAGVLEATVARMAVPPAHILAWLGPAIGPAAFEVGDEVRAAFVSADAGAASAFRPAGTSGKWLADLFQLARRRLAAMGVMHVHGGDTCTYSDAARFYSYRRDGATGRFASLIWREDHA